MKLCTIPPTTCVQLPNDLVWEDEFKWSPPRAKETYTLTGALIIEVSSRVSGRPISLKAPDNEMAWVTRGTLNTLYELASVPGKMMTLTLEQPTDTRSFTVVFKHSADPIDAAPIMGFPGHDNEDWYRISLKLIEVNP